MLFVYDSENENAYLLKAYLFHCVLTQRKGDSVIQSCDPHRCSEYMLKKYSVALLLARKCYNEKISLKGAMLHLPDIYADEFSKHPSAVAVSW